MKNLFRQYRTAVLLALIFHVVGAVTIVDWFRRAKIPDGFIAEIAEPIMLFDLPPIDDEDHFCETDLVSFDRIYRPPNGGMPCVCVHELSPFPMIIHWDILPVVTAPCGRGFLRNYARFSDVALIADWTLPPPKYDLRNNLDELFSHEKFSKVRVISLNSQNAERYTTRPTWLGGRR